MISVGHLQGAIIDDLEGPVLGDLGDTAVRDFLGSGDVCGRSAGSSCR